MPHVSSVDEFRRAAYVRLLGQMQEQAAAIRTTLESHTDRKQPRRGGSWAVDEAIEDGLLHPPAVDLVGIVTSLAAQQVATCAILQDLLEKYVK